MNIINHSHSHNYSQNNSLITISNEKWKGKTPNKFKYGSRKCLINQNNQTNSQLIEYKPNTRRHFKEETKKTQENPIQKRHFPKNSIENPCLLSIKPTKPTKPPLIREIDYVFNNKTTILNSNHEKRRIINVNSQSSLSIHNDSNKIRSSNTFISNFKQFNQCNHSSQVNERHEKHEKYKKSNIFDLYLCHNNDKNKDYLEKFLKETSKKQVKINKFYESIECLSLKEKTFSEKETLKKEEYDKTYVKYRLDEFDSQLPN